MVSSPLLYVTFSVFCAAAGDTRKRISANTRTDKRIAPRRMETSGETGSILTGRFQKRHYRNSSKQKEWLAVLVELVDRPKHVVAVGFDVDAGPDLPDHAVRVDQERVARGKLCYAKVHHRIVFSGHITFPVRQKLKGQALFGAEFLMGFFVLHTDTENNRVLGVILAEVPLEIVCFDGAAGGHVLGVKVQHHPFALVIVQADGLSILRIQREVRRL